MGGVKQDAAASAPTRSRGRNPPARRTLLAREVHLLVLRSLAEVSGVMPQRRLYAAKGEVLGC